MAAENPTPWFIEWANENNLQEFARLVQEADLASFVEGSETALTLFAPSNEAIMAVAHKLPQDMQLLRELVCVHITMGTLSRDQLIGQRSVTTIGQQTHHVQVHENNLVQVSVAAKGPTRGRCAAPVPAADRDS